MNAPSETSALLREKISPMQAVSALYGEGNVDIARAVAASLSRRVFEGETPQPSNLVRRALGRFVFRLMKTTTSEETRPGPDGKDVVFYRNRILEKSEHPYARTLLEPSRADTANFVEGGDPMNAVYMMLSPEVRRHAELWDSIILDSVQARDVQWRFVWETRLVHKLAVKRLRAGKPVRLKAVAAGTGLSMALLLEKLLGEGHDPKLISATISDREASNVEKCLRLLGKLPATSQHLALHSNSPHGIVLQIEDILQPTTKTAHDAPYDIVTVVGLLEYFPGHTATTTEELLGQPEPAGPPHASDVVANVGAMTAAGGHVLVNTFRTLTAIRTMEVFGKRFRYRGLKEMRELMASGGLVPSGESLSANIFDLEVFEKRA
ncbi:MAG: hypothetical protein ACKOAL_07470 [Chthoniobacterales bacterium]